MTPEEDAVNQHAHAQEVASQRAQSQQSPQEKEIRRMVESIVTEKIAAALAAFSITNANDIVVTGSGTTWVIGNKPVNASVNAIAVCNDDGTIRITGTVQ